MEKICIVILTLNEEKSLPLCLAAIPDSLEKVVIDSGSTDKTIDIAKAHGARVVFKKWCGFADQRNFAIRGADIQKEWILFIDADEIFPAELYEWANETLSKNTPYDAFQIPSLIILDEVVLRYAPGYPLYHPRLVRRETAGFVKGNSGHNETVRSDLRVARTDITYFHYWHSGPLQPWMEKHLRLAVQELVVGSHEYREVQMTPRMRLNKLLGPGLVRCILRFAYHYVVRGGFRDGRAGLQYSLMYFWFEITKWIMSREERTGDIPEKEVQK